MSARRPPARGREGAGSSSIRNRQTPRRRDHARDSGFSAASGGLVLRYWPTSRLWIEAGPASGDLRYGYENATVEEFAAAGYGVRATAGFTVLERPRRALDLQALSFDGFRAASVSEGVIATSRPR